MKVNVKVEGTVLGIETVKYGEKISYRLKVLQGLDSIGISVPVEKLGEVSSIPSNTKVTVLVEVSDYRDKSGFYMRFNSLVK